MSEHNRVKRKRKGASGDAPGTSATSATTKGVLLTPTEDGASKKSSKDDRSTVFLTSPFDGRVHRPHKSVVLGHCRSVQEFEKLNRLGEGTYGIVYRARDMISDQIVALKRVKMQQERGGMPVTSLREIGLLRKSKGHTNIVSLLDVVVGRDLSSMFLAMEYCEQDLAALIDHMPVPFLEGQVKCIMVQVVNGIEWLHSLHIIHRDMKMSNLLLTDKGILKIADFGMARTIGTPIDSVATGSLSPRVVTLWYRAPEVLFGDTSYSFGVDMWALGCIFGELLLHEPLMPGRVEHKQLELIVNLLGAPSEDIWVGFETLPRAYEYRLPRQPYNNLRDRFKYQGEDCLHLLNQLFKYDPALRISATQMRMHEYWHNTPRPARPEEMPTFPQSRNT